MPFNQSLKTQRVVADYSVSFLDDLIEVNTAAGAVAVTLPNFGSSTSLNYVKRHFDVVKNTSDANAVTISVSGGTLINGAATFVLSAQYDAVHLRADDQGGYLAFGYKASGSFTSLVATTAAIPAFTGAESHAGVITPTGGVAAAGGFSVSPRNWATGGNPVAAAADGSDYTVVATEVIIAEIFVAANATLTGVALFNGSAVAGNIKVGLANSAGAVVATSASTAQSGTDAYQRVPFTATYGAVGPATYYVLAIGDTGGGTSKINTHTIGNFGAAKQTGQVYATGFTTITAPSTFTTALGPIASVY